MLKQEDILSGIEIDRDGNQVMAKVPLRLTEAKLEVLIQVAKSFGQTLTELIESCMNQDIRCQLEGSRVSNPDNVGEALNKIMCDTWLKELGEDPEEEKIDK